MRTSRLAESLEGSEIIKIAGEVRAMQAKGQKVFNLTIGDFDSNLFPIPEKLKKLIIQAYEANLTNYPAGSGEEALRKSVSNFLSVNLQLEYPTREILISGGARPLIYAIYQTVLDANDTVLFPAPSWNNDAYTYLSRCKEIIIETQPENKFMPTANEIEPFIKEVNLIALCSPLNPAGTTFEYEELEKINHLILNENKRREVLNMKPVYLLYDQIYWQLTYEGVHHCNPVSISPEMHDYTIFIDGISKVFASTGVRVGWAFGPEHLISKMSDILGHIGAWAPKPEQIATAEFLSLKNEVDTYLTEIKKELNYRLMAFYEGFLDLKKKGLPVDVIRPEAAMYLTVKFDLLNRKTKEGEPLDSVEKITSYLLKEAQVALVPFYAFGANSNLPWFRLSIGTVNLEDVKIILTNLGSALNEVHAN